MQLMERIVMSKRKRAPTYDEAILEPDTADTEDGFGCLLVCRRCRDFVNAVVVQSCGVTEVVALHCWNCKATVPVVEGVVGWPPLSRHANRPKPSPSG